MRTTYLNMKSLTQKKFYTSAEEIMTYLKLFASMDRLTSDEYAELAAMTVENYPIAEDDPASEPEVADNETVTE